MATKVKKLGIITDEQWALLDEHDVEVIDEMDSLFRHKCGLEWQMKVEENRFIPNGYYLCPHCDTESNRYSHYPKTILS